MYIYIYNIIYLYIYIYIYIYYIYTSIFQPISLWQDYFERQTNLMFESSSQITKFIICISHNFFQNIIETNEKLNCSGRKQSIIDSSLEELQSDIYTIRNRNNSYVITTTLFVSASTTVQRVAIVQSFNILIFFSTLSSSCPSSRTSSCVLSCVSSNRGRPNAGWKNFIMRVNNKLCNERIVLCKNFNITSCAIVSFNMEKGL